MPHETAALCERSAKSTTWSCPGCGPRTGPILAVHGPVRENRNPDQRSRRYGPKDPGWAKPDYTRTEIEPRAAARAAMQAVARKRFSVRLEVGSKPPENVQPPTVLPAKLFSCQA